MTPKHAAKLSDDELNRFLAEKVMVWCPGLPGTWGEGYWLDEQEKTVAGVHDFNPSGDLNDAWLAAEKWRGKSMNWWTVMPEASGSCAEVHRGDKMFQVFRKNPARALSEAVALASGGE